MSGAKVIRSRSIFDLVNIHYPNTLLTLFRSIQSPLLPCWSEIGISSCIRVSGSSAWKSIIWIRFVCSVLQETRSFLSYTAARKFLTPLSHSLLFCTLEASHKTKHRHSTFRRQPAPSLGLYICERFERFEGLPPSGLTPLALWGGVLRKPVHHVYHLPF